MEIITLKPLNAHVLNQVAEQVFDHPINMDYLTAFLECPRHIMVLAIENKTVIGMASAVEYFHPDKPPQLWINEIGVTPNKQNKGIGRQLIQQLLTVAEDRKCIFAWLGTDTDNYAAQSCFNAVSDGEKPQSFLMYEWELDVVA